MKTVNDDAEVDFRWALHEPSLVTRLADGALVCRLGRVLAQGGAPVAFVLSGPPEDVHINGVRMDLGELYSKYWDIIAEASELVQIGQCYLSEPYLD